MFLNMSTKSRKFQPAGKEMQPVWSGAASARDVREKYALMSFPCDFTKMNGRTPTPELSARIRDVDCDNPPTTCAGSDQPDLITNIMQYSACLTGGNGSFTPGQLRRMQWTLVQQRPGLLGAN